MRVVYNAKHRYAISFKFGDEFLTSLTKLVLKAKDSIYSTIKEILLLYCREFSAFVVFVIIYHILMTRACIANNMACNGSHYFYR